RTSFQALQKVFSGGDRADLAYFVFDLLHLDGEDVGRLPLERRKARLAELLRSQKKARVRYSEHVVGHGPEVFARACRMGLEGIVSKRRDLPYVPGRRSAWVKVKCIKRQEFVVGGFTDPEGSRVGIGALLVGVRDATGALAFAGVRLTHPDRVLWPELGFTKLDLARFYEAIAESIVPHVAGRPLTLVRCPTGVGASCFYMKHSAVWAPEALRRVRIPEKRKI